MRVLTGLAAAAALDSTEGIEDGDEWYHHICSRLARCLLVWVLGSLLNLVDLAAVRSCVTIAVA
ncbi:hypothetical protein HanIR_Chr11g0559721 [Helianthus annuus]|nr:hypothetical protein HanIR_Chr11g0559721 [Helianthus annuus]